MGSGMCIRDRFNTVGSHDDKQLVKITGAPTYPSDGRLDLTTVYVTGGPSGRLNSINALLGWLDPSDAVIPEDTLYPPDTTGHCRVWGGLGVVDVCR